MAKKPILLARLHGHFSTDPAELPILEQCYEFYERANLHLAIEEISRSIQMPPTLIGINASDDYSTVSFSKLSRPSTAGNFDLGPVGYVDEPLPNQQRLSCVKEGLFLFQIDKKPFALLIVERSSCASPKIYTETMALTKEDAENFSHRLFSLVRQGTAFRGHILSLVQDCFNNISLKFHNLPSVNREQIILPEELLNRIERHTIAFSTHAKRLRAAGRHLKRGILLHGPPGTGKTFAAMYLASQMPDRTVFLITGAAMGSLEAVCNMARILEPSTIILEDVDLIGTQRNLQSENANSLLFELLNQMDGLADDSDILFLLTTNRPEVLEPALAARPGRIDQAIAVPPPDEECRRRLFDLYSKGLVLNVQRLDEIIHKLNGVSAAFIRELLRKAAVLAAIESEESIVVTDDHIKDALAELLVAGGTLTQSLLGVQIPNPS